MGMSEKFDDIICKNWYPNSRTMSDDHAHRGRRLLADLRSVPLSFNHRRHKAAHEIELIFELADALVPEAQFALKVGNPFLGGRLLRLGHGSIVHYFSVNAAKSGTSAIYCLQKQAVWGRASPPVRIRPNCRLQFRQAP